MTASPVRRLVPRTLTSRLVVTAVALVALISILVAAATTVAMHGYLTGRLDDQLVEVAARGGTPPVGGPASDRDRRGPDGDDFGRGPRSLGTLQVDLTDRTGGIVAADDTLTSIDADDLGELDALPADGVPRTVRVGRFGEYRVLAGTSPAGDTLVFGLPTREIDAAIARLLAVTALLALAGVVLASLVGTALVRRQLRPLHEVADTAHEVALLPLSHGGESIPTRVPDRHTDTRTEVGQVGHALNTLLDHVDSALDARHRSEQQVRQFVADASHELRTPLSTIHGYAELSRRTPDDAAALRAAMGKVETEAHRMSALVEDLLLLARLDQGRPLERSEVDLTRMLLELVADAQVLAPDHRWRLSLPDEPVMVTGDAHRLHQAVSNLVGNARRHTPPGTTVTLGASADGDRATVRVHDDGPGVPADMRERVFERFTRGDWSRTRADGGTEGAGLGLSLVRAIVEAHHGSVRVEGETGDTTFVIDLPR